MTTLEFWLACAAVICLCLVAFRISDWREARRVEKTIERLTGEGEWPEYQIKASECHREGKRTAW